MDVKYPNWFIEDFSIDNPYELFKSMDRIGAALTNEKMSGADVFSYGSCYQLVKVMDHFFKGQVEVLVNSEENHVLCRYIDDNNEEYIIGYDDDYYLNKSNYTNYGTVDNFEKIGGCLPNILSSKVILKWEIIVDEIEKILEYKCEIIVDEIEKILEYKNSLKK